MCMHMHMRMHMHMHMYMYWVPVGSSAPCLQGGVPI